ncbi:hypothetical protein [Pseudomonas sp. CGJS7]|uniref:hypothetical protein n=1 Tax=Pseudomonas sp. CGJS7 TaxID=3109348 RepID=UPI003008DD02
MPSANPSLENALTQFSNQPGVTPQQVAQLRVAIVGNDALLTSFNADAAGGHLTGFDVAPPGAASIGRYDVSSKTIVLPAEVFTGGPPANSDLRAVLRLQDMGLRFSQLPGVSIDMHENLQKTINGAPVLVDQFKNAVRSDQPSGRELQSFKLHVQGVAGGSYSPIDRSMNLVPASLSTGGFDRYNMTFVLGHEMEHGFNRAGTARARETFVAGLKAIASDANPINDFTAPSLTMMGVHRKNEAEAHIAGWNAMLSYEKASTGNPNVSLQDMWNHASRGRVADFLELDANNRAVARPGIAFNADGTLPSTSANVGALGRYYFDQAPVGTPGVAAQDTMNLGPHGRSDYANLYGAGVVSLGIWAERNFGVPKHANASQMHLNMQRLGFNETLLEENGISIAPLASQVYRDTSTNPPTVGRFDHTSDGPNKNRHIPVDASRAEALAADRDSRLETLDQLSPQSRGLFDRIRADVPAQFPNDVVAHALSASKLAGIDSAEKVAVVGMAGDKLFVGGQVPGHHAVVDVSQPPPSLHESVQKVQSLDEKQLLDAQQEKSQQRSQGGPSM